MNRPMIIQTMSRIHVPRGSATIWTNARIAPMIGTNGTHGVRKPRLRSGRVRRSTMTPADTNTNVLPSMHVIGCAALTLACFDSEPLRRRHLQWVMLPLGLVISMSTVFVKQHSILDVFVAIPVCVILYFIIYHRAFVKKFGKAANRDA